MEKEKSFMERKREAENKICEILKDLENYDCSIVDLETYIIKNDLSWVRIVNIIIK